MEILEQGSGDLVLVEFDTPHAIVTTWVKLQQCGQEWIAQPVSEPDAPIVWTLGCPFIAERVEFDATPESIDLAARDAMEELEGSYWDYLTGQEWPR